jgi:hypothetical protein
VLRDSGYNVILLGLLLQFCVFCSFAAVAVLVWRKPEFRRADLPTPAVRVFQLCLFTIGVLLLRNIWRVYDYGLGLHNFTARQSHPIEGHEWQTYVFDFALVWLVHATFTVFNFGWMLPPDAQLPAFVRPPGAAPAAAPKVPAVPTEEGTTAADAAGVELVGGSTAASTTKGAPDPARP